MWKSHPKALPYLFLSEMWERFGYYLMIGIFFLYMTTDGAAGGMGWENSTASDIYGTFIALAYLTPFMGGLLADLKLGYRFSITLGGILMGIGYCMLAIPEKWAFYTALAVMVVGNGFFKPNIATLLGNLYNDPRYRANKDTGYNIFYMGINVGALICNFVAATMRNKIGWHGAFITAGVGMFLGVITFWAGMKHYRHVDVRKEPKPEDKPFLMQFVKVLLTGVAFAVVGWLLPNAIWGEQDKLFTIISAFLLQTNSTLQPREASTWIQLFKASSESKWIVKTSTPNPLTILFKHFTE
jgi:POT family proton-dependent oligopeptide transporter